MGYMTDTKIANRAIQRVGGTQIGELDPTKTLFTEQSKNAQEVRGCYDILRRAELRRNVWTFSIRRVALRAADTNSKIVTFGAWNVMHTYVLNDVVLGSDGRIYYSEAAANTGNDPTNKTNQAKWSLFFNATMASEYVGAFSLTITYALGDHTVGSDNQVYVSLAGGNINHDPTTDAGVHWAVGASLTPSDDTLATSMSFYAGELVFVGNKVYYSLQNNNMDAPPSTRWLTFTEAPTVALPNLIYPIGAGPFSDVSTRNIYALPYGYLRQAPQAPKAGSSRFLGGPSALSYDDWEFADGYIITSNSGVIVFRFAADIEDPTRFDPLFIEGFASRVAFEICEPITQSASKLSTIASEYKQFMSDARQVNGIEQGPTEAPEDDWITCRR